MTRQESVERRDQFVKRLKQDLDKHLDFDFTRPEMVAAFLDKYWNYNPYYFIHSDVGVSHVMVPNVITNSNDPVYFEIGEIRDTNYDIIIHWKNIDEETSKTFTLPRYGNAQIDYDTEGQIWIGNQPWFFVVSRFWEFGGWFLNIFPSNVAPKFLVTNEIAKAMFPRLQIRNLSDYIQRLETRFRLPQN